MSAPQIKLTKRHIYAAASVALILVLFVVLIASYPWLQLQMGVMLLNNANYEQAERVLAKLVDSRPDWTQPRYKLVLAQLQLGKFNEAARTVISLADHSRLNEIELAVIFLDVGQNLVNTGNSGAALELVHRILSEHDDEMLRQAAIEVGTSIAEASKLPLALDAVNLILELDPDNWMLERKAFYWLLSKALVAPASHARPALERALDIFPHNTLAVTQMAKILAEQEGAQSALAFLVGKEEETATTPTSQEYLTTKRKLVFELAIADTSADLTPYIKGLPGSTLTEMALEGLNYAMRHNRAGEQFYQLQPDNPAVAYQFGRNLFATQRWQQAREIFSHLRTIAPDHTNFGAVFAAIDFHLSTDKLVLDSGQYPYDLGKISPTGEYAALRHLVHSPWMDDLSNELLVRNLNTNQRTTLGEAYMFNWSASGNYLAFLSLSDTGLGQIHIYSGNGSNTVTLVEEYDVLYFNWVGDTLMVQAALEEDEKVLLRLRAPHWEDDDPIPWPAITGDVNGQLAWLAMEGQRYFTVYQHGREPQRINLSSNLLRITPWSPNGRYAVIETETKFYVYDHNTTRVSSISIPGQFAGWAGNSQLYWYYPVWSQLHVLARLNPAGTVLEYLPYSFSQPVYDLSIASMGRRIIVAEDEELLLYIR